MVRTGKVTLHRNLSANGSENGNAILSMTS
jgi:hypothetical protein